MSKKNKNLLTLTQQRHNFITYVTAWLNSKPFSDCINDLKTPKILTNILFETAEYVNFYFRFNINQMQSRV